MRLPVEARLAVPLQKGREGLKMTKVIRVRIRRTIRIRPVLR